ncbi:Golgin subfamily A member 7/ERF4 family-domain-containing protein, partial [Clohesyomyces aquaticus]
PATTASPATHDPPSPTPRPPAPAPAPASPLPARWSLTNRIFNLSFRSLYNAPPRLPASRLWNPVNSSPRALALPNVPVQHPQIGEGVPPSTDGRDEYPLLTLPEQRRSRQSPAPSSLVVERSTGGDSGRTSIGLPRDRRSLQVESQPPTPKLPMPMEQIPAPAPTPAPAAEQDQHAPIPGPRPDDPEAGAKPLKTAASRASLPLSRPLSMHSQRLGTASIQGDRDADADDAVSEYAWGPSHPCFPHPNPHVPLDSPLYEATRIIRIKRDWMVKGDLAPTFANLYPEILDPLISEDAFRDIIKRVNDDLVKAFNPMSFRAWMDAVMGVATFWLWDDAGLTAVKRQLTELEKWLDGWNRNVGEKEGVKIISLRRTGYLTLDIQIPDPHIGVDNGTISRPMTQQDDLNAVSQQQHGEHSTYPLTPTFQVTSGSPVAIESQS